MFESSSFEGTEKKIELILKKQIASLRAWEKQKWQAIVHSAHASVVSTIHGDRCDAYLLSESSLFVYDHRVVMITCGQTTLIHAALNILKNVATQDIDLFVYERKHEYLPQKQHSSFEEDATLLSKQIPGTIFHFKSACTHPVHLFCFSRSCSADEQDTTIEVLMHHIPKHMCEFFHLDSKSVAASLQSMNIFQGFQFDEHFFSPAGYSLNAIKGERYITVHITPDMEKSYVSFESNVDFRNIFLQITSDILNFFCPLFFDLITFTPQNTLNKTLSHPHYLIEAKKTENLGLYHIDLWHGSSIKN